MFKLFTKIVILSLFANHLNAKVYLGDYVPKIYSIKQSSEPRALIVGGIHGDEHGAFLSASYLLETIKIKNGNITFLPFLNAESMVVNFRYLLKGGDINDKFVFSSKNDLNLPVRIFKKIEHVKKEILKFNPDLVLSLHAGWGYSYLNKKRWGNSIVIDDKVYKGINLYKNASSVLEVINTRNNQKLYPYTIRIINTFTKNIKMDMNDFSTWVLKNELDMYTIESSKNLRIRTQIYNTSFAALEFLKLYNIEVINKDEILSIENIKKFLNKIKTKNISIKISFDNKEKEIKCSYKERKVINVKKDTLINIDQIELDKLGYFIVPKSEKNYKSIYNFSNNINFKVKYFNIDKKKYDDFCHIKFVIKP